MPQPSLTFAHITDTHIGSTPDFARYGVPTLPALEALVEVINGFPRQPDFIIHTGDVSDNQSDESYALAAPVFARFKAPVYYVAGNHDLPGGLRAYLGAPASENGDPNARLNYAFEVNGERFLVVDVRGEPDPLGYAGEAQLEFLRAECTPDGPPLTVFIHYPPFMAAVPWLDANMIITNGAELHKALLPARDRLRGVFFGHLHRSCHFMRDGITYTGAASAFSQFSWWEWESDPAVDPDYPPGYSVVTCLPGYTLVRQYTFPRP